MSMTSTPPTDGEDRPNPCAYIPTFFFIVTCHACGSCTSDRVQQSIPDHKRSKTNSAHNIEFGVCFHCQHKMGEGYCSCEVETIGANQECWACGGMKYINPLGPDDVECPGCGDFVTQQTEENSLIRYDIGGSWIDVDELELKIARANRKV